MNMLNFVILLAVCMTVTACSGKTNNSSELPANQEPPKAQTQSVKPLPEPEIKSTGTGETNKQGGPSLVEAGYTDDTVLLDVPLIKQNPELKYGCEVTSLTMVLNHAGIDTDKLKLANELPKDNDPVKKTESGDITHWGNPEHGFVGDVTGKQAGFAVYAGPLEKLMKHYLQDRTLNLSDQPFDHVLAQLKNGKPVIVWTTGDYKVPDRWESWKHGEEEITAPLDLHAVVLVGYDNEYLYINDPLSGKKADKTNKRTFLESWEALGHQALSYQ